MSDAPHAITQLTLENFRNYRTLTLNLPPRPVVLRGHNGAGKTNILEAISLLAPGRGFRHARLSEMDRASIGHGDASARLLPVGEKDGMRGPSTGEKHDEKRRIVPSPNPLPRGERAQEAPWVVAAKITTRGDITQIGTGRDGESASEKRIIKINGEKIRGHGALAQHACIQWLTPAMDQVFVEGGSARRKLLDRIVYGFEPEHAARVTAYESATRERNRLLADRALTDPYWLSVLEQQMAEHAVAITLARQEVLERLRETLGQGASAFPRAELALEGMLETWLASGQSALDTEAAFAERLRELRGVDAASGRASTGAHRSQLIVIHNEKSMAAERCSTGEQKALLLSIILAAATARAQWCGLPPILLLDEVIAHLDVDKRAALFDLIRMGGIQAWLTGTDAADFQGLAGFATTLDITGGTVQVEVENS